MATIFNRLRRNPKPKPLLRQSTTGDRGRCVDSCCYENSACDEPVATGGRQTSKVGKSSSGKNSAKDAVTGRPVLRRSDTFTLKDGPPDELPDHIKFATYRKKKAPNRSAYSIIEQDVFESLYTKPRPTKPTTPVKPQRSLYSNPSQIPRLATSTSPFHFTPTPAVRPKNKSPTSSRRSITSSISVSSSKSQSPSVKPPEYLFGSRDSPKSPSKSSDDDFDRYRTITLRDVRRSFRDKYLPNNIHTDATANKHLPIWFVNVNESDKQSSPAPSSPRTSTDRDTYRSLTYMEFNEPDPPTGRSPKVTVNRNNTFKVHRPTAEPHRQLRTDDTEHWPAPATKPSVGLQRRETFKVHEPMAQQAKQTAKGYYLNRYRQHVEPDHIPPERPAKVIPVGIAVPYNSYNDRDADFRRTPTPPQRRHKSPSPAQVRPQSFTMATFSRKPHRAHPTSTERPHSISAPTGKISFDALRKPSEATRDPSKTNLGFDRFYDPNYYVPKNQNLFGPLATAHLRSVNVEVQPKRPVERRAWY